MSLSSLLFDHHDRLQIRLLHWARLKMQDLENAEH